MRPHPCDAFLIFYGMDKTSMSNSTKNRLNKKGFTLAEVLVTVAIILILAGVTFVSVAQYQKNLRLMEMDGTAKEIFIAAQNHLSVAKASGDLDRLAESASGTTDSPIGSKLESSAVSAYAGNDSGEYYSVIHNVTSGIEKCTPTEGKQILEMMLPFGALDETVATSGNYAIVYELKSASVVAVLYSGAGNASFGNAAVITLDDGDVNAIPTLYNDKSKRKSYQKDDVTAIVGCYTGTAGSAAIPTETLEAPKLEVKNENKLHVLVREAKNTDNITLVITGEQSGTTARRRLNRDAGDGYTKTNGTFDVTLDDITGDGVYRFSQLIKEKRFTADVVGSDFIPGENIIISAIASSSTALATPKESAKYTVSSLFDDVNETTNAAGDTKVYIKNLRHLENLGVNVSGFIAALGKDTTSGNSRLVNITAVQKNDITMFSFEGLRNDQHIYGSGTFTRTYIAANVGYPLSYDGGSHEIYDLTIAGYHAAGAEANAGIFGTVTNALSVKNLVLRNDKIPSESISANAGMLVGKTSTNLMVAGVLAYYHEDEYNSEHDSAVEVQASQVAGGLIGLVDGGKLSVKNSAAAVYVEGGTAAGGFIGSVSDAANGSIVQSYAGGHTRDGAYSTTDAVTNKPVLEDAGRYNVQATQASGYAGGFIGMTTDNVTMDAVYSTASAYSTDSSKSGSFSGNTKANFETTNNYYAIGPHNGTDASADETAKAQLTAGQTRRQATPYDRKLLLKDAEKEHKTMDKTSYPLCTVRNLCEGDASVKDTDLPWFIKEHVGDWVIHKESGKAGFEIENGNRLTVRIDTGLPTSTDILKYGIKVHGETSRNDVYFLVSISDTNASVKRTYYYNNQWPTTEDFNLFNRVSIDGDLGIEFYLDDITQPQGHFYSTCPWLIPGEDISISVLPETNGNIYKSNNSDWRSIDFSKAETQKTNSLYGYLQKNEKQDKHNEQKIEKVKGYYPNAGVETGLGLVPVKGEYGNACYYVQIDNSRHLENLSSPVAYKSKTDICNKITGAIQTDNIYWQGWDKKNSKDTFTEGFIEELGQNHTVNVYDDKGEKVLASSNHFSPISYSMNLKMYDGSGCKISGLEAVEQNGYAALFTQLVSAVTIKNLVLENTSFESNSQYTAGLIAYANAAANIDNVHFTKKLHIIGRQAAAGFVAHAANSITINNSSIENGNINSTSTRAGGLVAFAGQAVTLTNVKCTENLSVIGYSETGGFVGRAENSITVTDSDIENGNISSTNGDAAGIVSYAGQSATIDKVNCTGALVINGQNKAAGFAAQAANSITITNSGIENGNVRSTDGDAAGLISYAGQSATIKKVNCTGRLIIIGKKQAAGFVAEVRNSITITDSGIEEGTINSSESNAGGLIGYAAGDSDLSNITLGNKDSNKEDLNSEFHVQSNGKTEKNASAGGLIARASGGPTIKNVHFNLMLTVENTNNDISSADQDAVGGLIGCATAKTDIEDSSITNGLIKSIGTRAGGFVGCGQNDIIIKKSNIDTIVVSSTKAFSGGFVGAANGYFDINNTGLLADSMITSSESDAGGVVGHAKSGVNITNTKVIGSNTEIIAKSGNSNAGGLIGGFESGLLTINNSTASVFVRAESGNAGGLIGFIKGLTDGSRIDNSYYGGRTIKGVYGSITIHKGDSANEQIYAANIIAGSAAGGLIGAIEGQDWQKKFDISQCYSSGSVQTKNGPAGGFIGNANLKGGICLSINQCYSIGPVLKSDDKTDPIRGGFIGLISTSTTNDIGFANAYYLSSFNADVLNAIGSSYGPLLTPVQDISSPELITGQAASANLTAKDATYVFDETLKGKEPYPYQNWTTENETITYYGDWPVPQIDGTLVYYHRDAGDKKTGVCTLISSETSFQSLLTAIEGEIEGSGFGIIFEFLPQKWNDIKNIYNWSYTIDGPYKPMGVAGTGKYATFVYGNKTFYFVRVTADDLAHQFL